MILSVVDPVAMDSVSDFIDGLRKLKIWSGNPSLRELERVTGYPRSTLSDALNHRRSSLPRLEIVSALVRAFGCSRSDVEDWESAWKRIQVDIHLCR